MKEVLAELALMNWTLAALTLTHKPQELGAIPIMSQPTQNQDFQPLTQYDQSLIKNEFWINSTTKKIDPEGNVSQVATILPRVRPSRR